MRKSNKSQITLQTAPSCHGSRGRRGAAHSPWASQNPQPLASPRRPALLASVSHSQHCPEHQPVPSFVLPAQARRTKFCLFRPLSPSPRAVKGSPSPAKQLAETRCCQGGSGGKAREDGELLPLNHRSLPSRPRVLSRARGSTRKVAATPAVRHGCRE